MYKNYRFSRRLLLTLSLIVGLSFLGFAFIFIIEPPSAVINFTWLLNRLREVFVKLTDYGLFRSLFFVGVLISILIGAPHVFGGLLLVARMKSGIFLSMIASVILIVLSIISIVIFKNPLFMWATLLLGIIELIVSIICYISYYKYTFYFNELDYTDINKNNKELIVVYYSRDFYIKKYAYKYANLHKCSIYEIKTKEDLFTNKGLVKLYINTLCGKKLDVEESEIDFRQYKKVYLITGVIFKSIAAPVLDFCEKNSGKINSIEYDFVHYTPVVHQYSIEKLDEILQIKHEDAKATCMHFGKVINFKSIIVNKKKEEK